MDREKVIKGLECCLGSNDCDIEPEEDCPYKGMCLCAMALRLDVFAMLKAQEAKQVIKQTYHIMMNRDYENPVDVTRYEWLCPTCGSLLCRDIDMIDDNYHFCKVCGQEVKWDA